MKAVIGVLLSNQTAFQQVLLKAATYPRFHAWKRAHVGKDSISGEPRDKRNALFAHVAGTTGLLSEPIIYGEFGVHNGESIAWWYANHHHPDTRFLGFDSFQGLPEDWTASARTSAFDVGGKVPQVSDSRVRFVKGWFHETLPCELPAFAEGHRRVLHMDADLYRSTLYPLCLIGPYLRAGDIIIFDEFADSIHEFRAFEDFRVIFGVEARLIAATTGFGQVAFELKGPKTATASEK